jgi:hypothetical protein
MRVLVVEDIHRHTTLRAAGIELGQLTGTDTREGRIIKLTAKERPVPKVGPAPLSIAPAHASRAACHHPWVPRLLRKSPQIIPFFAAVGEKRQSCQAAHIGGSVCVPSALLRHST